MIFTLNPRAHPNRSNPATGPGSAATPPRVRGAGPGSEATLSVVRVQGAEQPCASPSCGSVVQIQGPGSEAALVRVQGAKQPWASANGARRGSPKGATL